MDNKKIKAVCYARVSSKMQEREGFSIPAQLDLLHKYANDKHFEIVQEFVESETAKEAGRTQFNNMLKYLKNNKDITNILVEKTDRLYRNFKDYVVIDESIYNVHLVKENKIISQNSSSTVKLEHGIKVVIAKNYIDNLREETQKGRKRKIEEGYFIGQVPYGYKKLDTKTTVPHPQKSLFVKRAFELYAKNNISLRALRQKLYDEGYMYLPSSNKISVAQLEHMLKNECYTGLLRYNGKLYRGKHEAIISDRLFRKVQQAFKKDNKPDTINKHLFLYKGLMKCGECGKTITCEVIKKKHIYYHCTGNSGKCPNKSIYIREDELDRQFDEAIKAVTIDESLADYINMLLKETYKDMCFATKEKAEYLRREIQTVKTNQEKLLDLLIAAEISKENYNKKNLKYDEQIENLERQLRASKMSNDKFINEGQKIIEQSKCLYSLYLEQNMEEKRKMLKTIFSNTRLDGRKLCYEYNRPFCYFTEITKNKKKLPSLDDIGTFH